MAKTRSENKVLVLTSVGGSSWKFVPSNIIQLRTMDDGTEVTMSTNVSLGYLVRESILEIAIKLAKLYD